MIKNNWNLLHKNLWTSPHSHLSNCDSANTGRQEGSIIIVFAKSISWSLFLSISSVSRVINLQLWILYHVTLWDSIDVMWSPRVMVQDLLFDGTRRCSEIDCPSAICNFPVLVPGRLSPLSARTTTTPPGTAGQLVASHWDGSRDTQSTVRCSIKDIRGSRGMILQRRRSIPLLPLHLQ